MTRLRGSYILNGLERSGVAALEHEEFEETQARIAAEKLTADIRSGALPPGLKLRVVELKARYGIGASPLREALLLVSSLGYVVGESHRGYRVAQMSLADLADIIRAREVVETGMLRESMAARSDEWAVGVVGALERLRLAVQRAAPADAGGAVVDSAHKLFHAALVSGCSSTRLAATQSLLFDQASRYREIMIGEMRNWAEFVAVHEDLANVALHGDPDAACEALKAHLNITQREVTMYWRSEQPQKA